MRGSYPRYLIKLVVLLSLLLHFVFHILHICSFAIIGVQAPPLYIGIRAWRVSYRCRVRKSLEKGRRKTVEVEMCLDGLLNPFGFVEIFEERKTVSVQEMRSFFMEFSREKENLLTMVVDQRLIDKVSFIES